MKRVVMECMMICFCRILSRRVEMFAVRDSSGELMEISTGNCERALYS